MKLILTFLFILYPINGMSTEYESLRLKMVNQQIKSQGVTDKMVLAAMEKVKRHLFVPEEQKNLAYSDHPLPIAAGQTISQPYIVGLMTELLHLKGHEKVLEIGTGSGYQAAVLGEIVRLVYSIEIVKSLAESSSGLLKALGYKNITVKQGDGYQGWKEEAPFDGIIVTAAPDHIPEPLKEQLRIGGRLVIPVGHFYQQLVVITRTKDGFKTEDIIPVRFVPMTGEAQL